MSKRVDTGRMSPSGPVVYFGTRPNDRRIWNGERYVLADPPMPKDHVVPPPVDYTMLELRLLAQMLEG